MTTDFGNPVTILHLLSGFSLKMLSSHRINEILLKKYSIMYLTNWVIHWFYVTFWNMFKKFKKNIFHVLIQLHFKNLHIHIFALEPVQHFFVKFTYNCDLGTCKSLAYIYNFLSFNFHPLYLFFCTSLFLFFHTSLNEYTTLHFTTHLLLYATNKSFEYLRSF